MAQDMYLSCHNGFKFLFIFFMGVVDELIGFLWAKVSFTVIC